MDISVLRRRCAARLSELPLTYPFDLQALCEVLAARRGRPLCLYAARLGGIGSGLWLMAATGDCIFFERDTNPLHQQHIVLHELGHLIAGHRPGSVVDAAAPEEPFVGVDTPRVQAMLARSAYSRVEEQEAEMVATLLLERMASSGPPPAAVAAALPVAPETAGLIERLTASFEIGDPEPS